MSATVASLTARSDGGQFALTQTANTTMRTGGAYPQGTHPLQIIVPHASSARTALGWSAVYRTKRLLGDVLVVDTAVAGDYLQLVLDHVETIFDSIDLNLGLLGYPSNTRLGPTGQPQYVPSANPTGVPQ